MQGPGSLRQNPCAKDGATSCFACCKPRVVPLAAAGRGTGTRERYKRGMRAGSLPLLLLLSSLNAQSSSLLPAQVLTNAASSQPHYCRRLDVQRVRDSQSSASAPFRGAKPSCPQRHRLSHQSGRVMCVQQGQGYPVVVHRASCQTSTRITDWSSLTNDNAARRPFVSWGQAVRLARRRCNDLVYAPPMRRGEIDDYFSNNTAAREGEPQGCHLEHRMRSPQ